MPLTLTRRSPGKPDPDLSPGRPAAAGPLGQAGIGEARDSASDTEGSGSESSEGGRARGLPPALPLLDAAVARCGPALAAHANAVSAKREGREEKLESPVTGSKEDENGEIGVGTEDESGVGHPAPLTMPFASDPTSGDTSDDTSDDASDTSDAEEAFDDPAPTEGLEGAHQNQSDSEPHPRYFAKSGAPTPGSNSSSCSNSNSSRLRQAEARVATSPSDEAAWLDYVRCVESSASSGSGSAERVVQCLQVMSRALESNPTSASLWAVYLSYFARHAPRPEQRTLRSVARKSTSSLSLFLSFFLSLSLSLPLSLPLSLSFSLSLFLSFSLSLPPSLFLSLSFSLSLFLSFFLSLSLSLPPSLFLSLSFSLSLSLSFFLSFSLSLSLPHSPSPSPTSKKTVLHCSQRTRDPVQPFVAGPTLPRPLLILIPPAPCLESPAPRPSDSCRTSVLPEDV